MATAQAVQTSPGKAVAAGALGPVTHRPAAPQSTECQPAEKPYAPDQITLVLLVGCAVLILVMNLFDVITGMLNW